MSTEGNLAEDAKIEVEYEYPANESEPDRRDRIYTDTLAGWLADRETNKKVKRWLPVGFSILLVAVLGFVVVSGLISINNVTMKDSLSLADVGVALAVAACVVTALLAIPKAVARCLFPSGTDADMLGLMKALHRGDTSAKPPQGG